MSKVDPSMQTASAGDEALGEESPVGSSDGEDVLYRDDEGRSYSKQDEYWPKSQAEAPAGRGWKKVKKWLFGFVGFLSVVVVVFLIVSNVYDSTFPLFHNMTDMGTATVESYLMDNGIDGTITKVEAKSKSYRDSDGDLHVDFDDYVTGAFRVGSESYAFYARPSTDEVYSDYGEAELEDAIKSFAETTFGVRGIDVAAGCPMEYKAKANSLIGLLFYPPEVIANAGVPGVAAKAAGCIGADSSDVFELGRTKIALAMPEGVPADFSDADLESFANGLHLSFADGGGVFVADAEGTWPLLEQ